MKDNTETIGLKEEIALTGGIKQMRFFRRLACSAGLLCADALAFVSAAALFRSGHQIPQIVIYKGVLPFGQVMIDLYFLLASLFILVRYVAGDYSKRQLFWDSARQTTIGVIIASLPSFLIQTLSQAPYPLLPDILSWAFVLFAIPVCRHGVRALLSKLDVWQMPTALIGNGDKAFEVCTMFRRSLSLGYDVRYHVSPEENDNRNIPGIIRIGLRNPANIVRRLSQAGCLQAIVIADQLQDEEISVLVEWLMAAGIEVAVVPQVHRMPMLGMTVNYFFGSDIILMHVRDNAARLPSRMIKRTIDFVGAIFFLTILSPLLALIALCIKLEGGQALFIQSRIGKDGAEFPCLKFRTMREDAEDMLKRWKQQDSPLYREYVASNFKLRNDPRVTRTGCFLRRTSLDELPQLFNVLIGDMSLVGPRPLLAREIGDYGDAIKLYQQLRPGITGLWQISGRSHTTFAERASADEWYVKNWSIWYDIVILFKTVDVLLRREGAF